MAAKTSSVYVAINSWEDVNWYLKEGFYIGNPDGITFPGFFTLRFDLENEEQKAILRKMILSARENHIRITTDDPDAIAKLELNAENESRPQLMSSGEREPVEESSESSEKPKISKAGETLEERRSQLRKCNAFFLKVADLLKDTHTVMGSASGVWKSACLVPKGTENQVTYYGKPVNSLRVACNWNWRASLKHCSIPDSIQCLTRDLPWAKHRPENNPELASPPIWGNMVGLYGKDQRYHCVYGEKFDRRTKTWEWVEGDPEEVAKRIRDSMKTDIPEKAGEEEAADANAV